MQVARAREGAQRRGAGCASLDFYYVNRAAILKDYRQLTDGSIDYAFYRAQARRLRRKAISAQWRALKGRVRDIIAAVEGAPNARPVAARPVDAGQGL